MKIALLKNEDATSKKDGIFIQNNVLLYLKYYSLFTVNINLRQRTVLISMTGKNLNLYILS